MQKELSFPKDIFSLSCIGQLSYSFPLQGYTCVRDQGPLVDLPSVF